MSEKNTKTTTIKLQNNIWGKIKIIAALEEKPTFKTIEKLLDEAIKNYEKINGKLPEKKNF